MKQIEFTVPGPPKGKERPRMTRTGHAYTPPMTREYEDAVKQAYLAAGGIVTELPLSISIRAYYPIPKAAKALDRELMASGQIRPMKTPDIDNIIKICMDGLSKGVAFDDDKLVIRVKGEKWYSPDPRVEIKVMELVD